MKGEGEAIILELLMALHVLYLWCGSVTPTGCMAVLLWSYDNNIA